MPHILALRADITLTPDDVAGAGLIGWALAAHPGDTKTPHPATASSIAVVAVVLSQVL